MVSSMLPHWSLFRNSSVLVLVCSFLFGLTSAVADTFVCRARDVGCLVASIAKANANGPGHDYVVLSEGGTFTLDRPDNTPPQDSPNGLPIITSAITLWSPPGQGRTLITRNPSGPLMRFFDIAPTGGLAVAGVTLQGGEVDLLNHRGGCIRNRGSLIVYHSTIRECSAFIGGGVDGWGEETYIRAIVTENLAEFVGGGLTCLGKARILDRSWIGENVAAAEGGIATDSRCTLTVENSVVDSNLATQTDGGGFGGPGTVTLTNSLVSNNAAGVRGGGGDLHSGTLTIRNSTLWGNEAEAYGGAIFQRGGTLTLDGVAVLFNQARLGEGGGVYVSSGATATNRNTWLLWNDAPAHPECRGELTLQGWNVIGDPTRLFDARQGAPCQP